ncbi:MAG: hypothetical protein C5B60_05510 [Chloroflexi bacterium]|nr:MAG: hypothetical protein C5B60_05510 [Chloroflexota bacterium]
MRKLSERAAERCANAKKPKCRCRCGGALHGKGHHGCTSAEIIGQMEDLDLDVRATEALKKLQESVAIQQDLMAGTGF